MFKLTELKINALWGDRHNRTAFLPAPWAKDLLPVCPQHDCFDAERESTKDCIFAR